MIDLVSPTQEERDSAARFFLDDPDAESAAWSDETYGLAEDWLILTDNEADEQAKAAVERDAWAFHDWFLVEFMPEGVTEEVIAPLQEKCEDANPAILSLIGERFDDFAEAAISADGRGHFLSSWDGTEHEFEHDGRTWYAYRS